MRSGLATRVDRIASRVARRATAFPLLIVKQYDRDDSEIVGLRMGADSVPRQPGETIQTLLERALAETGFGMWAADYRHVAGWDGESHCEGTENTSNDGPVWWREVPQ